MLKLTAWVPELAKELNGKRWSPNCDMIVHLEAQQSARKLGIKWGFEMPETDVEQIRVALRTRYNK